MNESGSKRELGGKKALVTGGSRGIGRAVCLELARRGADVAFIYHSRDTEAEATAAEVRALGRVALALKADLADAHGVGVAVGRAAAEFGRLDILVQAAGAMGNWHQTAELSTEDWDRYWRAVFRARFSAFVRGGPPLAKTGGGGVWRVPPTP